MQHARSKLIAPIVAAALSVLTGVRPARADVIERVVVVVNDDAILLSDLRRHAAAFVGRARGTAALEATYVEVLERLIDRALLEQAAREDEIVVTEADVERAIQTIQEPTGLPTRAQFWRAVAQQGLGTETEYRADIRAQLLHYRVLDARMGHRINVTEEDVRRRYDEVTARERLVEPYESMRMDIYTELRQAAIQHAEATLMTELRRAATIERRF